MSHCVKATPKALEMIERLTAEHGALAIFQSGGCCDGSSPMVLQAGELPLGTGDIELGTLASTPFYIDSEQYERWGSPEFLIDVGQGPAQGFSLSAPDGHLVTRSAARSAQAAPAGPS